MPAPDYVEKLNEVKSNSVGAQTLAARLEQEFQAMERSQAGQVLWKWGTPTQCRFRGERAYNEFNGAASGSITISGNFSISGTSVSLIGSIEVSGTFARKAAEKAKAQLLQLIERLTQ